MKRYWRKYKNPNRKLRELEADKKTLQTKVQRLSQNNIILQRQINSITQTYKATLTIR